MMMAIKIEEDFAGDNIEFDFVTDAAYKSSIDGNSIRHSLCLSTLYIIIDINTVINEQCISILSVKRHICREMSDRRKTFYEYRN